MSTPNKRLLSWNELDDMVERAIGEMNAARFTPEQIVPIARGGIIPAASLQYKLLTRGRTVEVLPAVMCSSYDSSGRRSEVRTIWPQQYSSFDVNFDDVLFVDEICDSGETIKHLRRRCPKAKYLSLVTKNLVPDFWATHNEREYWWVFPWEK